MTTKRNITIVGLIGAWLVVSLLSGCITSQNNTGLSDKESRMSEELIRSQVLRYKAEAQIEMATMNQIFNQLAPADAPFTPEVSASIAAAFAQMAPENYPGGIQDYGDSLFRYYLFYEELRKRGADMNGLEIDFDSPLQDQDYSPPPDDIPCPPEIQASVNVVFSEFNKPLFGHQEVKRIVTWKSNLL